MFDMMWNRCTYINIVTYTVDLIYAHLACKYSVLSLGFTDNDKLSILTTLINLITALIT